MMESNVVIIVMYSFVLINEKMIYSNITTRIIYLRFYSLLFLDINVSYRFQTLINRICSFEKTFLCYT